MKKVCTMLLLVAMILSVGAFASADALKIGFIGPLTGAAAVYGSSCMQGAQIAVDEINAAGGDLTIEFNPQDDEHDAEKSVNAYNNLWDWGCQMIVGSVTSTPCVAVAAEANNDRMFMLTPSASSTAAIEGNDVCFQVCFTDPNQGLASAQYISENGLGTKIAIIYNNADVYSSGIYQTFIDKANEIGLEVVSVTTFTDETTDFSVQIKDAADNGADLVFLPIYYTPASMIFNQAKAMDYAPAWFGVDGMDGILTMEGFDTSLAEGVMLLTPFSADSTDELVVKFVKAYTEKYNETPTQFSADGYDAVITLYEACKQAGITGETSAEDACEMLIETIQNITVKGTTGEMSWSANGEVTKTPMAVVIRDGAYVGM